MTISNSPFRLAILFALFGTLAACSDSEEQAAAAPAAPPPAVSFIETKPEALPITNDLPGRISPTRIAEVRPRVSGIVVERVFEQGSTVKEGDVLYRIDPASFEVQLASAEATLQRAKSVQLQARQTSDRQTELNSRRITSTQQRDDAVALLAQADADVAVAQAGVDAAKLNLAYSEVKAPISGRIGRALITEGALVNSTEILATIQQLDPVYVDFTQSSSDLLDLRKAVASGTLESPGPDQALIRMQFDDGRQYPQEGRLLFSEATVDQSTGQVTLRAEIPNPNGDLLPGMYVRVMIEQGIQPAAIAVPQQAVQRNTGGQSQLYVLNDKDEAELRIVQSGRTIGERVVIAEGLDAGERVIVEGFQKVRPGAPVTAEPWKPEDGKAAADAAAQKTAS
ncbi:efflux RND transporter periplasmic adaptor subunit [Tianweitania sp. BSSL-BM11]|uniref:Efflux RND transporter periplasmic adaptor subunit n=1 Tax=Tianweitania aestuarii TaxID=2814886 RepID=A0ABS5RTB4_9HYPH|nr:efflux RND transporter periplasmic adaptor subunit [Tianweitania aestuarii]MBS9720251.1 efflux RND transporter periplasmic adaptor subunit [Tianweitania aestuarii]